MKLRWIFVSILLLAVIFGGFLNSQESPKPCQPAEVNWKFQGVSVRSFGCVSFRNDSLILIPHFFNGEPKGGAIIAKDDIDNVVVYIPSKMFKASKS